MALIEDPHVIQWSNQRARVLADELERVYAHIAVVVEPVVRLDVQKRVR